MNNAVKNVMKFLNLPLEEVVKLASQNPAKTLVFLTKWEVLKKENVQTLLY